jgi:hypothetical protein
LLAHRGVWRGRRGSVNRVFSMQDDPWGLRMGTLDIHDANDASAQTKTILQVVYCGGWLIFGMSWGVLGNQRHASQACG